MMMGGVGVMTSREREAVVVCTGENMNAGISILEMETGEELMRIPTCASPPHGLVCLREQYLVASQIQKHHRSYAGGAIFIWALNKSQVLHRSYPIEPIGPISCTKNGFYLIGGAPSGNIYLWEVSSGRLLKIWAAHHASLSCLTFSSDDSLLISGSDDGVVFVWSMICLLDMADSQSTGSSTSIHSWSDHDTSITDLVSTSGGSSPMLISSSRDGTCKVRNLVSGSLLLNFTFSSPITAIALDPGEQMLYSGCMDGRICISELDIGLEDNPTVFSEDQMTVLRGHKGSIAALSISMSGLYLVSASNDCTACVWDVASSKVIRNFIYKKGPITNIVVIPLSLLSLKEGYRSLSRLRVSLLDKGPHPSNAFEGSISLLQTYCTLEDKEVSVARFRSTDSLNEQILDLEQRRTPEAVQMRVETMVEQRLWAAAMTKQLTTMNKHLQSRLLDLAQGRLLDDSNSTTRKRKFTDPTEHIK
ncbi:protein ROOT INITIATION DEFECTIVE 3 isoform X2 [Amborella trichopoda]|nr:protein ROOT INITIATION DEFECTIVE 3 isoform X2 [Amborella trichopoda]|eukprot:XP_006845212.3 protein ROOT INITIATION DEFECTIVE 3 isoform X2 [Amborella trichopoda]